MNKVEIISLLPCFNQEEVENYASYCIRLFMEDKNVFMKKKTSEDMAKLYKRVANQGLVFD
jgi:hypothetical protein